MNPETDYNHWGSLLPDATLEFENLFASTRGSSWTSDSAEEGMDFSGPGSAVVDSGSDTDAASEPRTPEKVATVNRDGIPVVFMPPTAPRFTIPIETVASRTHEQTSPGARLLDLLRETTPLRKGKKPHPHIEGRDYVKLHISWMGITRYCLMYCRDEVEEIENDDDLPPASLNDIMYRVAVCIYRFVRDHATGADKDVADPSLPCGVRFTQLHLVALHSPDGVNWVPELTAVLLPLVQLERPPWVGHNLCWHKSELLTTFNATNATA